MKICIPIESNKSLKGKVFDHFGSAPYFLIFNTENDSSEFIDNHDNHHAHGMCHPLKSLLNQIITAVICKGMGARAD